MVTPNQRIRVVDSHTGGEPTRLVLEGGPDLGTGPFSERVARFREKFDGYRSAIVDEPRGSNTAVGALLCEPYDATCDLGVIFFNNVGYLGMCGHGTIGVVGSLAYLGRLKPGRLKIDTPVGAISAELSSDGEVSIENVSSYRKAKNLKFAVDEMGDVVGDIAWGGNWFFLMEFAALPLELTNVEALTKLALQVRQGVNAQGFPEVDHVEFFAAPASQIAQSRNFVLCPGNAYDRSPCGTGTSAKIACLAADGKLDEGEVWIQESILGSTFRAHYRWLDRARGEIVPTIIGTAHVTAEATLLLDPADPFCWGVR